MIGHNETVVGYIPAPGEKQCAACHRWVKRDRQLSHRLAHNRVNVVHALRMEMNRRGVDFQPMTITVKRRRRRTQRDDQRSD